MIPRISKFGGLWRVAWYDAFDKPQHEVVSTYDAALFWLKLQYTLGNVTTH
jgi:hypothetical protein